MKTHTGAVQLHKAHKAIFRCITWLLNVPHSLQLEKIRMKQKEWHLSQVGERPGTSRSL